MPKVDYGVPPQRFYWLRPSNLAASRHKLRRDRSVEWRLSYERADPLRSERFERLLEATRRRDATSFRFAVLADSGEAGNSQYSLLPWLRSLDLSFLLINGDIAYPAGRTKDFEAGLFEPYRRLRLPIWGTPGNHEYYSNDKGRTYYQTFCDPPLGDRWHGMPHVQQPGSYWELKSPNFPLVVLGLDTGMKGNLDGRSFRQRDREQLHWLRGRLDAAERAEKKVLALFHLPPLARGKHVKKVAFAEMMSILNEYRCTRMLVAGHVHNLQWYRPDVFHRYLEEEYNLRRNPEYPIDYLVSGGGGSYLSAVPPVGDMKYEAVTFPSHPQWLEYASVARRVANRARGPGFFAKVAGLIKKEAALATDAGCYLSFLLFEVDSNGARMIPVQMPKLEDIVHGTAGPEGVKVLDSGTVVEPAVVAQLEQQLLQSVSRPEPPMPGEQIPGILLA